MKATRCAESRVQQNDERADRVGPPFAIFLETDVGYQLSCRYHSLVG